MHINDITKQSKGTNVDYLNNNVWSGMSQHWITYHFGQVLAHWHTAWVLCY